MLSRSKSKTKINAGYSSVLRWNVICLEVSRSNYFLIDSLNYAAIVADPSMERCSTKDEYVIGVERP